MVRSNAVAHGRSFCCGVGPLLVLVSILSCLFVPCGAHLRHLPPGAARTQDEETFSLEGSQPRLVWADSVFVPVARPSGSVSDSAQNTFPSRRISLNVHATVVHDSSGRGFLYIYHVENDSGSANGLIAFAVGRIWKPTRLWTPPEWNSAWDQTGVDLVAAWGTSCGRHCERGGSPPGGSVDGFKIWSEESPGVINFYAGGRDSDLVNMPRSPSMILEFGIAGRTLGPGHSETLPSRSSLPWGIPSGRGAVLDSRGGGALFVFFLPGPAHARLLVRDVMGHQVRVLVEGMTAAGLHSVTWAGLDGEGRLAVPGLYAITLEVEGTSLGAQRMRID